MSLDDYNRKRKFDQTPEPPGEPEKGEGPLRFVVQLHEATRLHYDFRIEAGGVFKSWAVPKGPSLDAQEQRLAVFVEDHPIAYGSFEGIIPKGNYGAGTVMVWDEGTYVERASKGREDSEKKVLEGLESGHITLLLDGKKLQGEFALVRLKDADEKSWLLIKKRDKYAGYKDVTLENLSVKTGRSMKEIAEEAPSKGQVWLPARGPSGGRKAPAPPPASHASAARLMPEKEKLPKRVKPMIPTAWPEPFDQGGWIFEPERDGYRAIAEVENGIVRIHSKALLPFNEKFPEVVKALQGHAKLTALLDGEIAAEAENGPVYWVRDLLHLDGESLRALPLLERKQRLKVLPIFNERVRYCEHEMSGLILHDRAAEEGWPALLARDAHSPYRSGTTKSWLRIAAGASAESAAERGPSLTHLDRVYFPADRITKGDLIEYYRAVAPALVPHLRDRPESMHRHPDGIDAPGFFHKDLTGHRPKWVETARIYSESSARSIDYLVCQNEATLLYMANLGCIELNPWLSRKHALGRPDFVVIDLDPDKTRETSFDEVIEVGRLTHEILDRIGAFHACKTSGSTGLHIYVPVQGAYDYDQARAFALAVCEVVRKRLPELTSLERTPAKRRGKIYLDCFQNAQGQTIASVYSVRPRPGAPVSTPLKWEELKPGLDPRRFHLRNTPERLKSLGDLWAPLLQEKVDLDACLSSLRSLFPI